jgi:hypothetical protein
MAAELTSAGLVDCQVIMLLSIYDSLEDILKQQ